MNSHRIDLYISTKHLSKNIVEKKGKIVAKTHWKLLGGKTCWKSSVGKVGDKT